MLIHNGGNTCPRSFNMRAYISVPGTHATCPLPGDRRVPVHYSAVKYARRQQRLRRSLDAPADGWRSRSMRVHNYVYAPQSAVAATATATTTCHTHVIFHLFHERVHARYITSARARDSCVRADRWRCAGGPADLFASHLRCG